MVILEDKVVLRITGPTALEVEMGGWSIELPTLDVAGIQEFVHLFLKIFKQSRLSKNRSTEEDTQGHTA